MDKHAMDVDTTETLAGVVCLLRRAAVLAWAAADRAGAGSPGQLFALGLDLAADQARQLVLDGTEIEGPVPVGDEPAGLLRSAELLLRRVAPWRPRTLLMIFGPRWPIWCGRRTLVSAGEGRTVAELLDDSDGLAREALLDMSADRAPGMVRGWPQLMQSAAELWAVLPPEPAVSGDGDPIGILAAMGRAVGSGLAAEHWPGRGPRDEAWVQIASNFVQARRRLPEQPMASKAVSTEGPIETTTARTQIVHALYVAAHATTVALTGYQRDLQHRLEVGARRRQPMVERPTVLEVESAGGMIARFDAVEQLAAGFMAARRFNPADQPATGRGRPATRLEAALAAWEIQTHRTLANQPDPADLVRVARVQALIATTTIVVSEAAARRGEIDAGVTDRLTPALENVQLAWSRSARRWAELTTPASRTDPALVEAAGQLRATIRAAVANQTGWATPEQIAGRIDLPATAMTLHSSLVDSVELAYITREIAADHHGLAAPARIIAVAAAAHLRPTEPAPRAGADGGRRVGRAATDREIPVHHPNRGGPPR